MRARLIKLAASFNVISTLHKSKFALSMKRAKGKTGKVLLPCAGMEEQLYPVARTGK